MDVLCTVQAVEEHPSITNYQHLTKILRTQTQNKKNNATDHNALSMLSQAIGRIASCILRDAKRTNVDKDEKTLQAVLLTLGYVLNSSLASALSDDQKKKLLLRLCDLASATPKKATLNYCVWCISVQNMPLKTIQGHLSDLVPVLATVIAKWPSPTVARETLAAIGKLFDQSRDGMLEIKEQWLPLYWNKLLHKAPKVRHKALELLKKALPSLEPIPQHISARLFHDVTMENGLSAQLNEYIEADKGHEVIGMWGPCIILLGKCIFKDKLINKLLKLPERLFVHPEPAIRASTFYEWHALINNFSRPEPIASDARGDAKIQLIVRPILKSFEKGGPASCMVAARHCWTFLMSRVGPRAYAMWTHFVVPVTDQLIAKNDVEVFQAVVEYLAKLFHRADENENQVDGDWLPQQDLDFPPSFLVKEWAWFKSVFEYGFRIADQGPKTQVYKSTLRFWKAFLTRLQQTPMPKDTKLSLQCTLVKNVVTLCKTLLSSDLPDVVSRCADVIRALVDNVPTYMASKSPQVPLGIKHEPDLAPPAAFVMYHWMKAAFRSQDGANLVKQKFLVTTWHFFQGLFSPTDNPLAPFPFAGTGSQVAGLLCVASDRRLTRLQPNVVDATPKVEIVFDFAVALIQILEKQFEALHKKGSERSLNTAHITQIINILIAPIQVSKRLRPATNAEFWDRIERDLAKVYKSIFVLFMSGTKAIQVLTALAKTLLSSTTQPQNDLDVDGTCVRLTSALVRSMVDTPHFGILVPELLHATAQPLVVLVCSLLEQASAVVTSSKVEVDAFGLASNAVPLIEVLAKLWQAVKTTQQFHGMLDLTQKAVSAWLAYKLPPMPPDLESRKRGQRNNLPATLKHNALNLWRSIVGAMKNTRVSFTTDLLKSMSLLWKGGLSSKFRDVKDDAIAAWNASFGAQKGIAYPEELVPLLRSLKSKVDISLPDWQQSNDTLFPSVPDDHASEKASLPEPLDLPEPSLAFGHDLPIKKEKVACTDSMTPFNSQSTCSGASSQAAVKDRKRKKRKFNRSATSPQRKSEKRQKIEQASPVSKKCMTDEEFKMFLASFDVKKIQQLSGKQLLLTQLHMSKVFAHISTLINLQFNDDVHNY